MKSEKGKREVISIEKEEQEMDAERERDIQRRRRGCEGCRE